MAGKQGKGRSAQAKKADPAEAVRSLLAALPQAARRSLLMDRTTRRNLIWGTDDLKYLGAGWRKEQELQEETAFGEALRLVVPGTDRLGPRAGAKKAGRQKEGPQVLSAAEANRRNNARDEQWFGQSSVFNSVWGDTWITRAEPVRFPARKNRSWHQYIDARFLEKDFAVPQCLVSRFDAASGGLIPRGDRIGVLDRKLRIAAEQAPAAEWAKWAFRALESCYGYAYRGDDVAAARIDVLLTLRKAFAAALGREPDAREWRRAARIASWNLWQMDGKTGTIPYGKPMSAATQIEMFRLLEDRRRGVLQPDCRVMDWRAGKSVPYREMEKRF